MRLASVGTGMHLSSKTTIQEHLVHSVVQDHFHFRRITSLVQDHLHFRRITSLVRDHLHFRRLTNDVQDHLHIRRITSLVQNYLHFRRITSAVQDHLHFRRITSLPWSAQSTDLSPAEHLWDPVLRRVQRRPHKPLDIKELADALQV